MKNEPFTRTKATSNVHPLDPCIHTITYQNSYIYIHQITPPPLQKKKEKDSKTIKKFHSIQSCSMKFLFLVQIL